MNVPLAYGYIILLASIGVFIYSIAEKKYRDLCYKPVCHKCGGEVRVSTHRRPWYCIEEHGRTEADWIRVTTLQEEVQEWLRSEEHGVSD